MEIIPIYPPFIYSIQYDEEEENEFDRLFNLWDDVTFVTQFFKSNQSFLRSDIWQQIVLEWLPMKSYGTMRPSLLRIYAIKMEKNTYLITGGGIKLADTIQNSPDLKDHIIQNIDKVRDFLKKNGIYDSNDMNN